MLLKRFLIWSSGSPPVQWRGKIFEIVKDNHEEHLCEFMSHCQNSSKFLSVSYLMKTADVIMNFFSSHNTTDHI